MHVLVSSASLWPCLTSTTLFLALACANPPDENTAFAIEHVNVIDVKRGVLLHDRTVVIRAVRITQVDTAASVHARDVRRVDGRGKYLMPGLWDMHTHVDDGAAWIFPASSRWASPGCATLAALSSTCARGRSVTR